MAGETPSGGTQTEVQAKKLWDGILDTALKVIRNPAEFYRGMAKTGGFVEPLIFMVVMGLAAGVVYAVFGLFHVGPGAGSIGGALTMLFYAPIAVAIFGAIGAGILFVIWKLMGSQENYEVAYRCTAYSAAVIPITIAVGMIPYVGALFGIAWGLCLLINSSVEVHKIKAQTARLVFGIIAALLALASISGEIRMRRMARQGGWPNQAAAEQAQQDAVATMKAMQAEAARQMKAAKEAAEKGQ